MRTNRMTRRTFLRFTGVAAGGAFLAACAPAAAPAPAAGGAAAPVEVRLMAWGNPTEVEAREATIDMFHQANSGITIRFQHTPDNYYDKLQTMLAGGDIPDVIYIGNGDIPSYATRNQLAAFDPLIERDQFDTSDIFPRNLALYNVDDVQYGFPADAPNQQLFYNVTRFQEAGIDAPSSDWADPSWDWDTFVEAAKALTNKEQNQWGWQTKRDFRAWWIWVKANGGSFFSEDGSACLLNEEPAVEAFQFLADLIHVHQVAPTIDVASEMGSAELFEGSITAMETWWPAIGRMRTNIQAFEWDVAPHPEGDVGKATSGGGTGHTIAQGSRQIDAAWEFVKFMISTKAVEKWTEIMGIVPPLQSVAETDTFLQPGKPPAHITVFTEGNNYLHPDPRHTKFPQARLVAETELDFLWTGARTAQEVTDSIVEQVNALIREG